MTTLDALLRTPALTTTSALIERASEAGRVADLIRRGGDEWPRLDDEERRTLARRLIFARCHWNADDRLRHRVVREETMVRGLGTDLATAVLALTAILWAGAAVIAIRVRRRRDRDSGAAVAAVSQRAATIEPGQAVRHRTRRDLLVGRVHRVLGERATVTWVRRLNKSVVQMRNLEAITEAELVAHFHQQEADPDRLSETSVENRQFLLGSAAAAHRNGWS